MKILNKTLHFVFAAILLFACNESSLDDIPEIAGQNNGLKNAELPGAPDNYCNDEPVIFDLIAGRTMNAGIVTLVNDDVNLYITYETTDGSLINEVHVYVGDEEGIPVNKQNIPIPGKFPYKTENIGLSAYTVIIPLSEISVECPLILTHAALSNGETAWGWENEEEMFTFENFFNIKRWGYLGDYCIADCEKYLTLKLRFYDANDKDTWAVINAVERYYEGTAWCKRMAVIVPTDGFTGDLVIHDGTICGDVAINIVGDVISVDLNIDDPEAEIYIAHVFYGYLSELNTYGNCPDYLNFPITFYDEEAASFEIPLD